MKGPPRKGTLMPKTHTTVISLAQQLAMSQDKKYPEGFVSVTEVLSILPADFDKANPHVLERAMAQGQEIHRYCALVAQGLWLPASAEIQQAVEHFRGWFEKAVEEVLFVERPFLCKPYMLGGTPDLIAILKGEMYPMLIDYKRHIDRKRAGLQLAAYHFLVKQNLKRKISSRAIALEVNNDGPCKAVDIFCGPELLQRFFEALGLYRYWKEETR